MICSGDFARVKNCFLTLHYKSLNQKLRWDLKGVMLTHPTLPQDRGNSFKKKKIDPYFSLFLVLRLRRLRILYNLLTAPFRRFLSLGCTQRRVYAWPAAHSICWYLGWLREFLRFLVASASIVKVVSNLTWNRSSRKTVNVVLFLIISRETDISNNRSDI